VIADRWCAAMVSRFTFSLCSLADPFSLQYGQPMMIDLADCDTMLPSVHDIRPALPFNAEQRPFIFNGAVLSLSILLGRILKGIYSPSEPQLRSFSFSLAHSRSRAAGIMTLSSEDATALIADLAS